MMNRSRSVVPDYVRPPARAVLGLPAPGWTAILVVGGLLVVEGYARFGSVTRLELVPVTDMAVHAVVLLGDPSFVMNDLLHTVSAIVISFLLAGVIGVGVAYQMSRSRWWRSAFEPYLNVFYALPTFALYPVMVVLFGTGIVPVIFMATQFSVVSVIANSLVGFDSVPPIVRKMSRSLNMSRKQHLRLILLPSALPDILAGLKLGLAYAIIMVLATEFILATHGLGHVVALAYNTFDTQELYAGVLLISGLGLTANLALSLCLARFDWRRW